MKKIILTFITACLTGLSVNAQYYDFSTSTGSYSPITGGTVISPDDWDDELLKIIAPFDFEIFGKKIDSFEVDDYAFYLFSGEDEIGEIAAFGVDLVSKGGSSSPVSYKVEGDAPNRVLIVQFENAGTFNDDDNEDEVNYQIRIYETTNVIEYHYGESNVNNDDDPWDGETGAWAGVMYYGNDKGVFLTGDPSSPTLNDVTLNNYYDYSLTNHPSKDMVYKWAPRKFPVSTELVLNDARVSIYPNPFSNEINISVSTPTKITLTDVQGRVIVTFDVNDSYTLNTEKLEKGIYFITTDKGQTLKLVK